MDRKLEVREFLSSRRAKITPREAGLSIYGGNRRVAGLRRQEVAMLAGVSVEYYVRPEPDSRTAEALALLASWSSSAVGR
jgi:hypothetical protein